MTSTADPLTLGVLAALFGSADAFFNPRSPGRALMPVSTAVAGPLAERLGAPTTLPGMSALGVTAALAFLAVPQVRALPQGC